MAIFIDGPQPPEIGNYITSFTLATNFYVLLQKFLQIQSKCWSKIKSKPKSSSKLKKSRIMDGLIDQIKAYIYTSRSYLWTPPAYQSETVNPGNSSKHQHRPSVSASWWWSRQYRDPHFDSDPPRSHWTQQYISTKLQNPIQQQQY